MTYYNMYREIKSKEELVNKMKQDIKIACVVRYNPNRLKVIKDAYNQIIRERNWE